MDSALELFGSRGYDAVRVEDVAKAAGVSRATFYNHFAEREAVLGGLYERLMSSESPVPDADDTDDAAGQPLERIERLAVEAARRMLAQPELARFLYRLPVRHEALLKPHEEATPAVFRAIHHLLEQARDTGVLTSEAPVDLMCIHIHNALDAGMRAWAQGLTDEPVERVRALVRLSLYGVASEPSRTAPRRFGT